MVVDLANYCCPNPKVHFVWLKVIFKSNEEITGLYEFVEMGLQFYTTDIGCCKPTVLSAEDCKKPFSARKEVQLYGVLNDLHYTAEEGDMQLGYIKMMLRKKYGKKIKATESGDEDRSPTE